MSAVETAALREYVVPLSRLTIEDVASVGGKNASLGEMIGALTEVGVRVPVGSCGLSTWPVWLLVPLPR